MILSALWTGGDLSGSNLAGRGLVCVKMRAIIAHPLLVLMICIGSCRSFLPRWSPKSLYHHARQKQSLARFIARTDTINQILEKEFQTSLRNTFGQEYGNINPLIGASKVYDGEYQSTVALQLGKSLKQPPKEIAQKIVSSLPYGKVIERAEVSGPGFINVFLAADYVSSRLLTKLHNHGQRVGIDIVGQPQRIVVDFSSPNIAKEMHVGHLRSTIIGDSISRVLEFLGNDVVRLNHVGDWGTQFGMLIHYLKTQRGSESDDLTAVSIGNLLEFYQKAKKLFDTDVAFQTSARQEVVRLQAGDVDSVRAWQLICQKSREEFQQIYDLLGVSLTERGESYYNAMLQPLVTSLLEAGVAEKSEDAVVIFLDKYKTSDGKLLPLIVRKSDGGFLYATTDVAALKHRVEVEKARRIIYVTDAGQAQHFEMVFDAARKAGILDDKTTTVTHVPFGLVLGEDGKKIKTRAGESVKLRELLLEAVDRARREFLSRSLGSNEEDEEVQRKAVVMGMGAVKYADLSMNRESNYRFSFDKMLSLQGNTAPYMLYAYVRIRGIQRKMLPLLSPSTSSGETVNLLDAETLDGLTSDLFLSFQSSDFLFSDAAELSLARHLLRSDDVLLDVANSLYPNKMCEYLFELSQRFNQFYENCPVVKAPDAATMRSRLALCTVTAHTIRLYLHLLGIQTLEEI